MGREMDAGRKKKGERLDGGKEREDVDAAIKSDEDHVYALEKKELKMTFTKLTQHSGTQFKIKSTVHGSLKEGWIQS